MTTTDAWSANLRQRKVRRVQKGATMNPDLCQKVAWSPIGAAASQSAIAAVLAGFVFSGIIVLLSVTTDSLKRESAQALKTDRESAQALKLLFTAFFGLAVTSYLLAVMAGEQKCPRAETIEALAGGALGAFAVIMITSLTWLVVAYKRHTDGVLEFLHALVYVGCLFVALLLTTNSLSYIGADLIGHSHSVIDPVLVGISGISLIVNIVLIWWRSRYGDSKTPKTENVSTTTDRTVNWCAWAALIYLALISLATGIAVSLPPGMWFPAPAPWGAYLIAAGSLVLPLGVLSLAIGALARTVRLDHGTDDKESDNLLETTP
jgi:hypothetical protein